MVDYLISVHLHSHVQQTAVHTVQTIFFPSLSFLVCNDRECDTPGSFLAPKGQLEK